METNPLATPFDVRIMWPDRVKKRLSEMRFRLSGVRWNFDLGEIPNTDGFLFMGLFEEGTEKLVRVVREGRAYTVKDFRTLVAWRRV